MHEVICASWSVSSPLTKRMCSRLLLKVRTNQLPPLEDVNLAVELNELMLKLYRVWFLLGGCEDAQQLQRKVDVDPEMQSCKYMLVSFCICWCCLCRGSTTSISRNTSQVQSQALWRFNATGPSLLLLVHMQLSLRYCAALQQFHVCTTCLGCCCPTQSVERLTCL